MAAGQKMNSNVVMLVLLMILGAMVMTVTAERIDCNRPPYLAKVRFNTTGYTQSIRYDVPVPRMKAFTVQFWINLQDASRNATVLSYALNIDFLDTLILKYIGGERPTWDLSITGLTIFREASPVLTAGQWYHIVVSWNSPNGCWSLFVNGRLVNAGINNRRLYQHVQGGGIVAVGGLQETFQQGQDTTQGVEGWVTHFNLDSRAITDPFSTEDQEQVMAWNTWCPVADLGNVIGWITSPRKLFGGPIEAPAKTTCYQF